MKKKGNPTIIFVLLLMHMFLSMIPYLFCSPILMTIATDIEAPATMIAYIVTSFGIIGGICMFIGSFFINQLGYINAFLFATCSEVVGYIIVAVSGNFPVFMLGRVISAFGYGLNSSIIGSIASFWFKDKKFTAFNTMNTVCTSVAQALTFVIAAPLVNALGGNWRGAYWIFSGCFVVYIVLCWMFVKYPEGVGEALAKQRADIKAGIVPKPEFALKRAAKRPNFIKLMIGATFIMICHSLLMTYLPTMLTTEVGFSSEQASSITATGTLVGMIGSILGGILCAKSGRRKVFQWGSAIVYAIAAFILVTSKNYMVLFVMFIVLNISFYIRMPAMSQYLMEDVQPFDPTIIAPAAAITSGAPSIFNLFGSAIASSLILNMGYSKTLMIFAGSCVLSVIAFATMTECGPHAKINKA